MKINKILVLASLALVLASCNSTKLKGDNNYDTDKETTIVDDGEDTSYDDENKEVDTEVETPSEYDSFSNGVIPSAGKYYLKGEYDSISITASKGSELYVFLDGVTINSSTGIAFGSEKQVTLHLVILNNSVNSITNDFLDTNSFHVKGNVYLSGNGTLNVESKQKNGFKVSKDLYISEDVTLNVTGQNHAISARSLITDGTTINVAAKTKDGVQLEVDSDTTAYDSTQGYAYLVNTKFTADTYGDGIQANTYIYISGGEYNITTHGEFVSYSSENMTTYELSTDDFKYVKSGSSYKRVAKDEIRSLNSSYYALTNSVKGIKVSEIEYNDGMNDISVTSGDYDIYIAHAAKVTINSTDDCIHSNYGDVNINGATLVLDTFDDGVHADYDLNINNASITVNSSYEGLEGGNVTVDGENTVIVTNSLDDGINAVSDYVTTNNIYINNGYLRVYASGDGLDANTGLYLKGGEVIVEGPGSGNGSLDAERVYFQGGVVFACSTSGMSEQMSATQNTFFYQGSTMSAGKKISITDSDNNVIFSYTLKQSCNQIIFSSPELKLNSSYKIVSDSTTVATINMTSSLTKVGSSGGPGGGGHGGPGGR